MQVTVLSPHHDDAAFSCGLTLHSLVKSGNNLTIVNVCSVSRYAPYFVGTLGDLTGQVTELRRTEDAAFVEKLRLTATAHGGGVELIDLKWQEVPLRWRMRDEQALAPLELPPSEVHQLGNAFRVLPSADIVLVPMALGGHIDHRLTLQAAKQAISANSLVFYEDLPYASRMSALERTLARSQPAPLLSDVWLPCGGSATGMKREYALCYPSQISSEVAEEMESYAAEHGYRERFLANPEAIHKLIGALRYKVDL